MHSSYQEKYNYTLDYIEASAKKYQTKIKKDLDFIQFESLNLRQCTNELAAFYSSELQEHQTQTEGIYTEISYYFDIGYNSILIGGYGSKYDYLQKFGSEFLSEYPIITVNGFVTGLTIKYVVNKLTDFLKHNISNGEDHEDIMRDKKGPKPSAGIETQLEYIRSVLNNEESGFKFGRVVVLVHNIDGKSLRNPESQSVLSTLASLKRVTLIASVDHYMYQTLLTPQVLENFNFKTFCVNTYAPYKREFQFSEEAGQKGNRKGADALKYIFRSFTSNQKEIVKTLAKYMLDNHNSPGVEFKQFFSLCFDHAMISHEAQLKENLLEVLDHKVIKEVKGEKGRILYTMEFTRAVLEQIVEENFE